MFRYLLDHDDVVVNNISAFDTPAFEQRPY